MDLTTYEGLQAAIASYLNRADLADQIPAFIALAEARFNRELQLNDMLTRTQVTTSEPYIALPSDWSSHNTLSMTSPAVGPLSWVTPQSMETLRMAQLTGPSKYYTVIGQNIALLPAPGTDSVLDLVYYAKVPVLSATNPSNWLLAKAPDLYLYGSLLQAEPYLINDERVALWAGAVDTTIAALRKESWNARFPQGGLRMPRRTFG